MKQTEEKTVCALCGHIASGKFVGDICPGCGLTYWKCGNCDFLDVTSYIPDFGRIDNIDPRL